VIGPPPDVPVPHASKSEEVRACAVPVWYLILRF
jgi:hypothetical protein